LLVISPENIKYLNKFLSEILTTVLHSVYLASTNNLCVFSNFVIIDFENPGSTSSSYLRHRKVAGSISDVVIGILHCHNPPGHIMTMGLTQPLTEMSIRNIFGVKGGRCIGLTTLESSWADFLEIWEPQLCGTLKACPGL
jgi:hypothetical protein